MAEPQGDLFRLLVKDLLTFDKGWAELRGKWTETPGIYDVVKQNLNNFAVFGIEAWRGKNITENGKKLSRIILHPQKSPLDLIVWSDNKMETNGH